MGENFRRIKAHALLIRLIKSLLAAISLGLLSSGVLLLLTSYKVFVTDITVPIVTGIISFLVGGGISFLILRLSDKKIAARIDNEFGLEERVGTMLQYKEHTEAIHELQRNNANEALNRIPIKVIGIETLWIYITAALLAVAVFVSSLILKPAETPPPPIEVTPFSLTELQEAAIEEVIAYVENSDMQSPYRENVRDILRGLLDELKVTETEEDMKEIVAIANELILIETDNSSYALELIEDIWNVGTDPMKRLAEMLNYYNWPKADEEDKFEAQLKVFRTSLIHADSISENPDFDLMTSETALLLTRTGTAILTSLTKSGMPADDALYIAITSLASAEEIRSDATHMFGLSPLGALGESLGYTDTQRELDQTFAMLKGAISEALAAHRDNTSTGEYAVTRICQILDCEAPQFERPLMRESSSGGESSPDGDDSGGVSGGIGSGTVFGSDDLVLDPDTNTYVEYGTILEKYYAIMFGKLQDGDYTEEEKAAMEKYFAILYGGFDDENEES